MFTNPEKNLKAIGLSKDMIVADLGAGTGFYSVWAANLVPDGKVYAIEVQKDFLDTIRKKAKEENLTNLECLWGDVEKTGGTKIADGIVDIVIASNILSQVQDKNTFLNEAKRILKITGRLLLIDHKHISPVTKNTLYEIIPKEQAQKILENQGFSYIQDIDAGAYHYGMIFKRPPKS
jgi:FkbM family methyltransferase